MIGVQIFTEWVASFIEIVLYFAIVHAVRPSHFSRKKQAAVFCIISAIIAVGILFLNMVNLTFSLMTIIYWLLAVSIGSCILYKGKFAEFLFVGVIFLTGLNLLEGLMILVINSIWSPELTERFLSGFSVLRMYIIISFKIIEIIISSIVCMVLRKFAVKLKSSLIAFLCSTVGFVCVGYWLIQTNKTLNLKMGLFESILAVACIFICCTVYFFLRFREIQKEQEYTYLENKLLKKSYQVAKESYESNARLYHDMKNHFLMMQNYLADGKVAEAQRYLEKLSADRMAYSVERWTGVEAIDYILSQKIDRAKQSGIITEIYAEYPKDCGIDPVDLCTILTNLLDNAIEACLKIPEGLERKISVTIRRIHQFIIIRIANSNAVVPVIQSGNLVTSKKNGRYHGWGVKSVKAAVERLNGTIEYEYSESLFTVNVMIFYQ
ncbi:sensor histidine kinase [Lachnospiraceae bacterium SGI.066]